MDYELLDSGGGYKLERFGKFRIMRPSAVAIWDKACPNAWERADASFSREDRWDAALEPWTIELAGVKLQLKTTDFGHLGVFPEHALFWPWLQTRASKRPLTVLNLFAYSGGASLALAKAGAQVTHLDSSKGMCDWAKENARLNQIDTVRWIVDDALKFMQREIKRGKTYDAIILDPPSFGRGSKGEVFKIEEDILPLLKMTKQLLSDTPDFVLFSCHTPGFSPRVMDNLMQSYFSGMIDSGEMLITPKKGFVHPSGTYARWIVD